MSIKIYTAYRIPKNKLNEFTLLVNQATWNHIFKRAETWLTWIEQDEIDAWIKCYNDKFKDHDFLTWDTMDEKAQFRTRWRILAERIVEDSTAPDNRLFELNASFNFWLDGRYAYVIPYGEFQLPDDVPDWIEDYHYQNQTDRPKNITARQWAARCRKWHKLCLDDWDATRYHHTISDFRSKYCSSVIGTARHLGVL